MRTIATPRLTLRPYIPSDFIFLAEILGNPEVMRYVFKGTPFSLSETEGFIKDYFLRFSMDPFGLGVLCDNATNQIIGCGGITPCNFLGLGNDDYEIGFAFAKSAWGKEYATEIGCHLIKFAFEELKLKRVLATVHPGHVASKRVLEKLEMQCIGDSTLADRGKRQLYSIDNFKNE